MFRIKVCTNEKYVMLIFTVYGLVLQSFLQVNCFGWFGYLDEIIALFFLAVTAINILNQKVDVFTARAIASMGIVVLMAIVSTLVHGLQPLSNAILDLFANIKFVATLLGALFYFSDFNVEKYAKRIAWHIKLITWIFAVLTLLDMALDLFPDSNYQFYKHGMKSLRLIYGHPATLSVVGFLLFAILSALKTYNIDSIIHQVLLVFIMTLTFRAKIIGTIAIVAALFFYVCVFKKKITIRKLIALLPFAALLAWGEIQSYYVTNAQASRLVLTQTSIEIAKDLFPLGSGLGTFASAFSKTPYSPIYSMYDISQVWGLSEKTAHDISDTFWPMILGQFGIIALAAYLMFVYYLYKRIQKINLQDKFLYLSCWMLFTYLLVASTSESAFVNAYAVYYGIFIAVFIASSDYRKRNEQSKTGT